MSIGKPDLASRLKRDGRDVMKGVPKGVSIRGRGSFDPVVGQRRKSLNVKCCGKSTSPDILEHSTFFPTLYSPLYVPCCFSDTNWPQPYGVNPSVETVGNWHTTRTCRVLDRPPRTKSESSNFSIKGSLIRRRLHPHVGLLSWTA